jgi:hypothetical protein
MKRGHLIVFLLAFAIGVSLVSSASGAVECSICGKEISGRYYISAKGQTVCGDCYAKYPPCVSCGLISKTSLTVGDRIYCPTCYAKLKKCDLCGEIITGQYHNYPGAGLIICQECERTRPKCDRCGIPANELIQVGTSRLCARCVPGTDRCHICGTALLTEYAFFEGDRSIKYCPDCVERYQPCADCGAPSGPHATVLDDGRHLCPDCRSIALFDHRMVTPVKEQVFSFLESVMDMRITHSIAYSMQDVKFLKRKSKGIHGDLNGLFYRKGDDYHIYVLYGLRKKDLVGVLAHEMAHAWQSENCRTDIPLDDLEGFAQWVAYHALSNLGYREHARTLVQGNNIYAEGLRRMLEIEARGGSEAVFDYIKSR